MFFQGCVAWKTPELLETILKTYCRWSGEPEERCSSSSWWQKWDLSRVHTLDFLCKQPLWDWIWSVRRRASTLLHRIQTELIPPGKWNSTPLACARPIWWENRLLYFLLNVLEDRFSKQTSLSHLSRFSYFACTIGINILLLHSFCHCSKCPIAFGEQASHKIPKFGITKIKANVRWKFTLNSCELGERVSHLT